MSDDIHNRLLKTVHAYFKKNQEWENRQTHVSGIEARRLLSEIRRLASVRRDEIQAVRADKPKTKSPKYRQSILKDQGNKDAT
jgi:hypothetical protein